MKKKCEDNREGTRGGKKRERVEIMYGGRIKGNKEGRSEGRRKEEKREREEKEPDPNLGGRRKRGTGRRNLTQTLKLIIKKYDEPHNPPSIHYSRGSAI